MRLVLDGSITLAWCFRDEATPAIDAIMMSAARDGAIVPAIWRLEVANGLRSAIRRRRMEAIQRDAFLAALGEMNVETDLDTDRYAWSATVQLADRHGLTPYDACYLELAIRAGLPLASLDGALGAAARAEKVRLIDAR